MAERERVAEARRTLAQLGVTVADLRAADVRGTDLSRCLFLTRPQVTAATGDATTRLPDVLTPPAHWR